MGDAELHYAEAPERAPDVDVGLGSKKIRVP